MLILTKQDNEEWKSFEFAKQEDINTGDPVVVIGHGMGMLWTTTQGHITVIRTKTWIKTVQVNDPNRCSN